MKKVILFALALSLGIVSIGCSGGSDKAEPVKSGDYTSEPGKATENKPAGQ